MEGVGLTADLPVFYVWNAVIAVNCLFGWALGSGFLKILDYLMRLDVKFGIDMVIWLDILFASVSLPPRSLRMLIIKAPCGGLLIVCVSSSVSE